MKACVLGLLAAALVVEAATVKTVCASGCDFSDFQSALDAAQPGWVLELKAGEVYNGSSFTLKRKTGTGYIVIRSSRINELDPQARVTPADSPKMAALNLTRSTDALLATQKGAAYYRFEGIEFRMSSGVWTYSLIELGTVTFGAAADHEVAELPRDIVFDRCYIHGNPGEESPRRGIMANCGRLTVINSRLSEIKSRDSEAQAIAGWNSFGPFYFRNNYFSASAITTLFGGAEPNIRGVRATDVTYLGNHYYRPWKWRSRSDTSDPSGPCLYDSEGGEYYKNTSAPTYWRCDGGAWVQISQPEFSDGYFNKNQFELKNASRVRVDGNLIENAWLPTWQSQHGAAFLFNQVDNDGYIKEPAAVVEYVRVENNRIRNTPWGVSVGKMGTYYYRMHDISLTNNLFEEMGKEPQSLGDVVMLQSGKTGRFRFAHNTAIFKSTSAGLATSMNNGGSDLTEEMEFYGNIVSYLKSGFMDTEKGGGSLWWAIDNQWSKGRAFSKNLIVDTQDRRDSGEYEYPKVNLKEVNQSTGLIPCASCAVGVKSGGPWYWENSGNQDVGFANFSNGDYRLTSTSPYKGWGHMGKDPGADLDIVDWSTAHAADGAYNPYLDFRVRALTPARVSASVRYTAYNSSSCSLVASDRPDFVTTVFQNNDGGGNRDRLVQITGLAAGTRYFYGIQCAGTYRRNGEFLTSP